MPSFLDHIVTFRQRPKPHLATAFHSENFLDESDRDSALPGRSGLRIQHCFNLLSAEHNERYEKAPEDEDPWQIRQAAAYHSFDPVEGRSLWILVKGNDKLRERISTATQKQRAFRVSSVRSSKEKAFVSNLVVHRVMLEWCAENWNDYIEHLEEEVKPAWKSRLMPVTEMVDPEKIARRLSRKKTIHESASRIPTLDPQSPMSGSFSEKVTRSLSRLNSGFEFKKMLSFRRTGSEQTTGTLAEEPEDEEEEDHVGNYFSFTDLQKLTRIGDNLEQSQMVMEQNMTVLKEIRDYYEVLVKSDEFSKCIDVKNCHPEISSFFQKMVSIERSLEVAKYRIQSLARMLESNKELYYGVLQYENNEVGKVYAHYAKMSTDRMEDIARKTEQETVSMHVITIFTLLFLPGTFIAVRFGLPLLQYITTAALTLWQTFFSSGVFEWDEDGKLGKDWKMRGGGMKLFMAISIPLMLIVLSVWFFVYWLVRRSRQNRQESGKITVERELEGKSMV